MADLNIAQMLSVLAEPTRIRILECISREGEMCAKDILPVFVITQPTLSHHLNLLLDNDILSARKDGRFVYYSVNKKSMEALRKLIDSFMEPPVVGKVKRTTAATSAKPKVKKPVVKKKTSVPMPKTVIASPDLEELKKAKKKKKSDKKKKEKDKKDKKKK